MKTRFSGGRFWLALIALCAAGMGRAAEEKAASPEVAVRRLLTAMTFGDEEGRAAPCAAA